jgi:hypothetical protein
MADAEPERPFYQRPWFAGTAAVVALLVSVAALVGPLRGVIGDLFSSELPRSNAEIVFDSSAKMEDPFGNGTELSKFQAAADAVKRQAATVTSEGLALRRIGGTTCSGGPGEQLVGFGANHGQDVADAVSNIHPAGQTNLTSTVLAAIDDFAELPPNSQKRVVIFTGTADDCYSAGQAHEMISNRVDETHINAEFDLVGVNASAADQRRLDEVQSAMGDNVHVTYANSKKQLEQAATDYLPPTPTTKGTTSTTSTGQY